MSETTQQFKKQLPKNAIMAILSFVTYSVTAVWLTPYLVEHLGAAAYGLIPLAGLFTQYASIITAQLSGAVNRFLTIEILKPDGNPNVIFNSAFALYLFIIAVQIPLFWLGIRYANHLFSIPPALKQDAMLLLGFSCGSFLINMLGAVFGVSIYSKNRLDIGALMQLVSLSLRLVLILVVFSLLGPKLRYIGFIDFGLRVLMFITSIVIWKRLTPELRLSLKKIDRKILGPIFHMSFWTLFNQLGSLLYLRTDIWIINRFISPLIAGQYAAILVVSNFIRQLANLANSQLGPVTMSYWAKGEKDELRRMLSFILKIFSIGLAIMVALLCINSKYILSMWLGADFEGFELLFTVMTAHLCINTAVYPLFQFLSAANSVRLPALVTFFMGVTNVVVSYWLGVSLGMGALGVALATAIVLTLKNAIFTPIYGARILELPAQTFMMPLFGSLLVMAAVYGLSFVPLVEWVHLNVGSFSGMLLQASFIITTVGLCSWIFIISPSERRSILQFFVKKLIVSNFFINKGRSV